MKNNRKTILVSVDVEDWFQVENFKSSIAFDSWDHLDLRVERNTHRILDLLDDSGLSPKPKATFFVLGWIAQKRPELIRQIHGRGHEIASHGINHHLCTHETVEALQRDLTDSKSLLEDITGAEIAGYRAPSFSVNDDIIKIIEDAGYGYDSSFNSFDKHGRYGKLSTGGFKKTGIAYKVSDSFYELPISNLNIFNRILPWGGGGYFRLLPYLLFKRGLQKIIAQEGAYSFYLHPWELDQDQPRVKNASASLKFRHYVNLATTAHKISKMLNDFNGCRFLTCKAYLAQL